MPKLEEGLSDSEEKFGLSRKSDFIFKGKESAKEDK
jgi:hypothetical protein